MTDGTAEVDGVDALRRLRESGFPIESAAWSTDDDGNVFLYLYTPLADRGAGTSYTRVRSALKASGLSLPLSRIRIRKPSLLDFDRAAAQSGSSWREVTDSVTEVSEAEVSGFWSYVHRDDTQANGRILRLATDIQNEFALLSGRDLELFVDRDNLAWGDEWRNKIDSVLSRTTFFIPVVTPRFFKSHECRRELLQFATLVRSISAEDLIFPIHYVDVADLHSDASDEAKSLLSRRQMVDWRDLRLTSENSEQYRRAVNGLAVRLIEIADNFEARPTLTPAEVTLERANLIGHGLASDDPGLNDQIAELESALPAWVAVLEQLPIVMQEVTAVANSATGELEEAGSFAERVLVARRMAQHLDPASRQLFSLGEEYAERLLDLDPGVRAVVALAEAQDDPAEIRGAREMFDSLRDLIAASHLAADGSRALLESLEGASRNFRDLRPPLRRMEAGLRSILDGISVMDEWEQLIAKSSKHNKDSVNKNK